MLAERDRQIVLLTDFSQVSTKGHLHKLQFLIAQRKLPPTELQSNLQLHATLMHLIALFALL